MNDTYIGCYFYEGDEEILGISLPSQPFKIGDVVKLSVKNRNPEKWDVQNLESTEFKIISIEISIEKGYAIGIAEHVDFILNCERT